MKKKQKSGSLLPKQGAKGMKGLQNMFSIVLFLLIWVARRCAVDVAAFAENTVLFRFFANNTPLSVISFL